MSGQTHAAQRQDLFASLLEEHKNAVYAVAYCTTGDGAVSEDVTQEAFLEAWKSLESLREPTRFRAWICGIARNLARNENRRRRRHPEEALEAEGISAQPNAVEHIVQQERLALLWQSLGKLDEKYREVLSLYYQQGQRASAVAQALGISEALVHQRLKRGREQLKDQISATLLEDLGQLAPSRGFSKRVMSIALTPTVPLLSTLPAVGTASSSGAGWATIVGKIIAMKLTKLSLAGLLVLIAVGAVVFQIKAPASSAQHSAASAKAVRSVRQPALGGDDEARAALRDARGAKNNSVDPVMAPSDVPPAAEAVITYELTAKDQPEEDIWNQVQGVLPGCAEAFLEDTAATNKLVHVRLDFRRTGPAAALSQVTFLEGDAPTRAKSSFQRCLIDALADTEFPAETRDVTVRFSVPPPVDPEVLEEMQMALGATAVGPSRGVDDAKVTLVVYTDFKCSHCSRVLASLDELLEIYPTTLRVVTKLYPIKASSRRLAEATTAAGMQDHFWPMHDLIFAHQDAESLSDEELLGFAEQMGLDLKLFEKDWKSETVSDLVQQDLDDGQILGVTGTPTIFVNREKLMGALPIKQFQELIDAELAR